MKDKISLYLNKGVSVGKFALGIVIIAVLIKTVLIPVQMRKDLSPQKAESTEPEADIQQTNDLQSSDYSEIIDNNPFGKTGGSGLINGGTDTGKTVSRELGIKLLGTISGGSGLARAIIEDTDTDITDFYKINQQIKDATIKGISKDSVILIHNGQRKILRMDSSKTNRRQAGSFRPVGKTDKPELNIEDINKYLQDFKPDVSVIRKLLDESETEPYREDKQIKGLRLKNISDIPELEALGFKNGDIIHKVNDQQITSKQKAYQVLRKSKSSSALDIEISRDNNKRRLMLNLK